MTTTVTAFPTNLIPSSASRSGDDPIFALNAEAQRRAKAGESVINATLGALMEDDGTLAVMPSVIDAFQRVPLKKAASYAPIAGDAEFLRAVIQDLYGEGPLAEQSVAVATPGGTGALHHAVTNFLEPGQALLTTSSYWGPYQTLADEADRKVETFAMFDANGGLDVGALDAALAGQLAKQKRALIFLNDPCHNPTGYSMSDAEWKAVVECILARAKDGAVTLLVDTAYFAYNPRDPRAFLAHLRPLLGKVGLLFAWSASKTFTHYGLRVGALVAPLIALGVQPWHAGRLAEFCRLYGRSDAPAAG